MTEKRALRKNLVGLFVNFNNPESVADAGMRLKVKRSRDTKTAGGAETNFLKPIFLPHFSTKSATARWCRRLGQVRQRTTGHLKSHSISGLENGAM